MLAQCGSSANCGTTGTTGTTASCMSPEPSAKPPKEAKRGLPGYWEQHDADFHRASRQGWRMDAYGGVFPYKQDPPIAVRPHWPGKGIELPKSDWLRGLPSRAMCLGDLFDRRRSRREPLGITDGQLATLLSPLAIRRRLPDGPYESLQKALPSGGGMHGLEAYVSVRACEGVPAGIWHYAADDSHLYPVAGAPEAWPLLDDARGSAGQQHQPAVLITLAARFSRWQWKYRRMAYAAILKDVGVVYAYLCLVGEAMRLNVCPLGGGDSETFARMTGLDPVLEGSVGELAVW